jgi:hypothetical protein
MVLIGLRYKLKALQLLALCIISVRPAAAGVATSDWNFSAVVGWAWRDIDGTMFSFSPPLSGAATADSLGLGSSSEPDAAIGVRWKRLDVRFVYLPSRFKGDGVLLQSLDFGSGPVISNTTPINSDLKVTMTLANIEYLLLKQSDMDVGVGVGIGQVELDITMTPQTGNTVDISGDVPFGYLSATLRKRWGKLALSLGLQGLSVSQSNTSVAYKSLNIAGAYRFWQREKVDFDILAGYRYTDFDYEFDDDNSSARSATNFELTGPYVGLRANW